MSATGLVGNEALALRSFAFERLSAIAAVLDGDGVVMDTNDAWRLFAELNEGSVRATGAGVSYLDVCDRAASSGAEGAAEVSEGLRQILGGEREHFDLEYPCSSPTEDRWFMLQASLAPVGDGSGVVLFHVNITARKLLEARLASEAEHDELTGLPNRRSGGHFLEGQCEQARGTGTAVRVLFFDLDGFKVVNDTYGHHVGDELLVQVAARARRAVREADLVCRVGGDEFFVVCTDLDRDEARVIEQRLRDVMSQPFQVGAEEISIGASVGLASSDAEPTADLLLDAADAEMYIDKRRRQALADPAVPG